MGLEEEVISVILDVKDEEAKQAQRTLEALSAQAKQLGASLEAATITEADYRQGLKGIADQAEATRAKLSGLKDEMAGLRREAGLSSTRLEGADRRGTQARLGLAAANMAQDVLSTGNPANAINNALGLAGDPKAMALLGEGIEKLGGLGNIAAKTTIVLAGLGIAVGAVRESLESADLKLSDLGTVLGNTAPAVAATEAFEGLSQVAKDLGITSAIDSAWDAAGNLVNVISQVTIGWNDATAAARAHRDEEARQTQSALEYLAAVKATATIRSDEQKKAAELGKNVGEQLANLGGAGGLGAVASRLAEKATAKGADEKIDVPTIGRDGKVGKPETITRRELERRNALTDLAKASAGDTAALGRLMPKLKNAGFDLSMVQGAAAGRDYDKEAKQAEAESKRAMHQAEADAKKAAADDDRRAAELAKPIQKRYDVERAGGDDYTEANVRSELSRAGVADSEVNKLASAVLEKLRRGFDEDVRERAGKLGTGALGAEQSFLLDAFREKIKEMTPQMDEARQEAEEQDRRRSMFDDPGRHSQVFEGASAIRNSIQASIGADATRMAERQLDAQNQQLSATAQTNKLLERIAMNRPDLTARFT